MVPTIDLRGEISKKHEFLIKLEKQRKEEEAFVDNYFVNMKDAIDRDIKNIDVSFFPEELTNKHSPLFSGEDTFET